MDREPIDHDKMGELSKKITIDNFRNLIDLWVSHNKPMLTPDGRKVDVFLIINGFVE